MSRVDRPHFVTPHALAQFRERVAPWSDPMIYGWLQRELQRLPDEADIRRGTLMYGATCCGKAITVVVGPGEGSWPAVVTVIGDQERLSRLRGWRGARWHAKDSRRLEVLRRYGYGPPECARIMGKTLAAVLKRWEEGSGCSTAWTPATRTRP